MALPSRYCLSGVSMIHLIKCSHAFGLNRSPVGFSISASILERPCFVIQPSVAFHEDYDCNLLIPESILYLGWECWIRPTAFHNAYLSLYGICSRLHYFKNGRVPQTKCALCYLNLDFAISFVLTSFSVFLSYLSQPYKHIITHKLYLVNTFSKIFLNFFYFFFNHTFF